MLFLYALLLVKFVLANSGACPENQYQPDSGPCTSWTGVFSSDNIPLDWVQCPESMYFNLNTLQCEASWPADMVAVAKDSGYVIDYYTTTSLDGFTYTTSLSSTHNISVWRPVDTYINYYSGSKLEMGTPAHPYKFLDHALYNEFNFPSTGGSINFQIVGEYAYDIDFPVMIKTPTLAFNTLGSTSKVTLNLYPSSMKDKGYTAEGQNFRIRGPTAYSNFDIETESPYFNIKGSTLGLNNLNIVAGTTNVDTFSKL